MPKMRSTKDFLNSGERRAGDRKFHDWKKNGKTFGWIHPGGIYEREVHSWIPVLETQDDGSTKIRKRKFNCAGSGCPLCALIAMAESLHASGDVSGNAPLISAGGHPDLTFSISEIAGAGPWNKKISSKREYVVPWVPRDGRDPDHPVEVMSSTFAVGRAIQTVIRSQIEDYGESRGDPMLNPYPLKLTYDSKESPQNKYHAERVGADICPMTDEIQSILNRDLEEFDLDLDGLTEPGNSIKILEAIQTVWLEDTVPWADFESYVGLSLPETCFESGPICTCGHTLEPGLKFCPECGEKVSEAVPQDPKPAGGSRPKAKCPECGEVSEVSKTGRTVCCAAIVDDDVPF